MEPLETEYERIWAEFGAGIARLASSYEWRVHAREDLLQDIRLAIWTALPRYRGEASPRTFVFRIAHNRALTHVWKRKRADAGEQTEVADGRANPESAAINDADRARLIDAIRTLPIPYRQAITLALEDLPQVDIAAILGISENNVAVRMNRARKLLKEKLGGSR